MSQVWVLEDFLEELDSPWQESDQNKIAIVYADLDKPVVLGFQGPRRIVFVGEQEYDARGFKSSNVELEVDKSFFSKVVSIERAFKITFDCADQQEVECAFAICSGLRLLTRESKEGLSLAAIESFIKGAFNKTPLGVEVGLFGELLAMYLAKNPGEAVNSWHSANFDTYDFGNVTGYLEVKTTSTATRAHWLSLGQIQKVPASKVTICSFVLNLLPDGCNIEMLTELLVERLTSPDIPIFLGKLAKYPLHTFTRRFDLESALESMKLYSLSMVPVSLAPVKGVLNQKWLIDFQQVPDISNESILPFSF